MKQLSLFENFGSYRFQNRILSATKRYNEIETIITALETIVLYDFIEESPRIFTSIICLIPCIVGYFIIRHTMRNDENGEKDQLGVLVSSKKIIIGLFFILFGFLMFIFTFNLGDYFNTRKIYKKSKFQFTEGYLRGTRIVLGKVDRLNFYINDAYFELASNNIIDYGCNFQDIKFNEIPDSTYLKISYIQKSGHNVILKMEKVTATNAH